MPTMTGGEFGLVALLTALVALGAWFQNKG